MARKKTSTKVQCNVELDKKDDRLFRMLVAIKETTVRDLLQEAIKFYLTHHESIRPLISKIEAEAKRA